MNRDQLITKLNWFYSLELNQVDWYISQSKAFTGTYSSRVLERVVQIEQQHANNIEASIRRLGQTPTILGDVISPILGSVAGKTISLTGLSNTFKVNILLERKAMRDYSDLIIHIRETGLHKMSELKEIRTPTGVLSLIEILRRNYIDEDLHTSWFAKQV